MHKTANVLNLLASHALAIETKRDAEKAFDFFLEAYGAKYDKAIACSPSTTSRPR